MLVASGLMLQQSQFFGWLAHYHLRLLNLTDDALIISLRWVADIMADLTLIVIPLVAFLDNPVVLLTHCSRGVVDLSPPK